MKIRRGSSGFDGFLTKRQQQVLFALARETRHGQEITASRMAQVLGTHKTVAKNHLNSLTRKGLLKKEWAFIRGRREGRYFLMWNAASAIIGIPDLNDAPLAQRQGRAMHNVLIQDHIFGGKPCMRATVSDDSLAGRGLMKGDVVLVSADEQIKDGDIVAVEIGREQRIGFRVVPVKARRADDKVWGKVVKVIRNM